MPKISVIIPVYNEAKTIRAVLQQIDAVDIEKEVIIIDDGSTDGTREILKALADDRYKVILLPRNQGKGFAIREGIKYISGDIVIIQDADLEYDPRDYPKLIEPIISGKSSVVFGSRWLDKRLFSAPLNLFKFGTWLLTFMVNLFYRAGITDESTCYKVFKAEVIKGIRLECRRFEFCPEVTAKICRQGYRIYEVPISYSPRSFAEGKKINLIDGVQAIWVLIKYRVFLNSAR